MIRINIFNIVRRRRRNTGREKQRERRVKRDKKEKEEVRRRVEGYITKLSNNESTEGS